MLIDDKIPIQLNYTPYSEVTSDVLWVGRSIVIQPGLSDNMLELIYKQARAVSYILQYLLES